jgi:FkbM family methyltransferase
MFIGRDYEITGIEQPTRILDLGAHIGAATLFFCVQYPNALITSYEPDPDNFLLLKKNLSTLSNVTCVNAAVAATSGSVSLHKHKGGSTRGTLSIDPDSIGEITVPAVLFEEVVEDGADMVKFDVEGAEYNLFAAAPKAVLQKVKVYVGEFHDALSGKTPKEFEELFPGFSFTWKDALATMRRN